MSTLKQLAEKEYFNHLVSLGIVKIPKVYIPILESWGNCKYDNNLIEACFSNQESAKEWIRTKVEGWTSGNLSENDRELEVRCLMNSYRVGIFTLDPTLPTNKVYYSIFYGEDDPEFDGQQLVYLGNDKKIWKTFIGENIIMRELNVLD